MASKKVCIQQTFFFSRLFVKAEKGRVIQALASDLSTKQVSKPQPWCFLSFKSIILFVKRFWLNYGKKWIQTEKLVHIFKLFYTLSSQKTRDRSGPRNHSFARSFLCRLERCEWFGLNSGPGRLPGFWTLGFWTPSLLCSQHFPPFSSAVPVSFLFVVPIFRKFGPSGCI